MPIRFLVVAVTLLASTGVQAADQETFIGTPFLNAVSAEPSATRLLVGDDAPTFSYLGVDGQWHRSADLCANRAILLVFGARDENLAEIERSRSLFDDLGVTPVVVLDRRCGAASSAAKRLGLTSHVVADPKCAIADLFNSIDPLNHHAAPSFFVIDGNGTIRTIGHGQLPTSLQMLIFSARGLGLPLPESAWSALAG